MPNMREIREEYSLSQKDMAEVLEVTPALISFIETGKIGVSKKMVGKIKDLFSCDVTWEKKIPKSGRPILTPPIKFLPKKPEGQPISMKGYVSITEKNRQANPLFMSPKSNNPARSISILVGPKDKRPYYMSILIGEEIVNKHLLLSSNDKVVVEVDFENDFMIIRKSLGREHGVQLYNSTRAPKRYRVQVLINSLKENQRNYLISRFLERKEYNWTVENVKGVESIKSLNIDLQKN